MFMLTIPNATPLKAVWYSKLGVGSSGLGYAKDNRRDRLAQKYVTEKQMKKQDSVISKKIQHKVNTDN